MRRIPPSVLINRIFILSKVLELDQQINSRISDLSEGSKRKASLLVSMVNMPELLILDEPTKGVDQIVGTNLMLAIQYLSAKFRQTVLFTSKRKNDLLLVSDS